MIRRDIEAEQTEFAKLFYPDSDTYKNKAGIKDAQVLERYERAAVAKRAKDGLADANIRTYEGYKAIHRHLFQDVYDWAGKERKYTPQKGGTQFTAVNMVEPYMKSIFKELQKEKNLENLSKDKFAERAAYFVNNVNAGHAFADGNGRTQRMFLRVLADKAGYQFELSVKDKRAWHKASEIGFFKSDKPMADLIKANLTERRKSNSKAQVQAKTVIARKAQKVSQKIKQHHVNQKTHDRAR